MLLRGNCAHCVSDIAPVCLAAVLDYLVAELLGVASGVALANGEDEELNNFAANMTTLPPSMGTVWGCAAGHEDGEVHGHQAVG
ncbi:unnamed protein product [Hydatigera taeniaeformis]|uniref:Uncharacterized protein n=1 Tax=Hydatigena taeniaeformis TaxID=6205 RepID=A0A0R3XDA2_HYDTA|nr:unnamed protein product [Hydatigera taeniaeformis]